MGLRCSRQGYMQDIDFGDRPRLAPEGECFPGELLKNESTDFGLEIPASVLQNGLVALLNDERFSKRLSESFYMRSSSHKQQQQQKEADLIDGETTTSFIMRSSEDLADLPPEGKVANDEVFVELPPSKHEKPLYCERQDYVELPDEDTTLHNRQTNRCLSDGEESGAHNDRTAIYPNALPPTIQQKRIFDETSAEDSGSESNDQWLYTLYDFERKGLVTKQALSKLMDSICAVVEKSSTSNVTDDGEQNKEKRNNVKVHLEIGHRKNNNNNNTGNNHNCTNDIGNTVRSPNKYAQSREYKGMIFPPPNSEEAEKLKAYIKEKILTHRQRLSKNGGEARSPTSCYKCKSTMKKNPENKLNKDKDYVSKRKNTSCTCASVFRGDGDTVITRPLIHRSHSFNVENNDSDSILIHGRGELYSDASVTPSSSESGSNTPQSYDEVFPSKTQQQQQKPNCDVNTTMNKCQYTRRRASAEDNSLRFHHSCSCNNRGRTVKHDDHFKNAEKYGKHYNCRRRVSESIRKSDDEYHIRTHCDYVKHPLSNSKCSSRCDSSCENETTTTCLRTMSDDTIKRLYNKDRTTHRKITSRRASSTTEQSVRHETLNNSNKRPEVWPGCSSSVNNVAGEERQHRQLQQHQLQQHSTKETTSSTQQNNYKQVVDTAQLCFCKRMLGLDHPCNHGPSTNTRTTTTKSTTISRSSHTVHHRHKHEHHHYHYYVPRGVSADVS